MKKIAAIILAVMLIMVSIVTAYAADVFTCPVCNRKYATILDYNTCIDTHSNASDASAQDIHKCDTCGKMFDNLEDYNECVGSHFNNVNYHYDRYVGLTIPQLLTELTEIFNKTGTVETVQTLMDKMFELANKTVDENTFADTISQLEEKINDLDLSDKYSSEVKDIIDDLKNAVDCESKNEITDKEIEVTEAEPSAETGSSAGVGIVAFAAVSAALAAAYVTVSKKK